MAGIKSFFNKLLSNKTPSSAADAFPAPSDLPTNSTAASATNSEEYSLDSGQSAAELYEQVRAASAPINAETPDEELCGLHAGMTTEDVEQQLAYLYRRYNRAAASLDATMNREAEIMLDAIVAMRKKYLGK